MAIVTNSLTPYKIQLQQRLLRQIPEVDFFSLQTHAPSFRRWAKLKPPKEIRPVSFHRGEPSNEQTRQIFALREFQKGGQIIRWLKQHQIDAVLCQGYGDLGRMRIMRWCHRQGIPSFLYSDHNVLADPRPTLKRRLKYATAHKAIGWCRGVMPCGTNGRAFFERCGAVRDQVFYFPFIPDIDLYAAPPEDRVREARERWSLSDERRRLLFVGRMVTDKRPDLLLQAFATVAGDFPDWDLLMIGDGPLRAALQARSRAMSDRVMWVGQVDETPNLAAIFQLSDVLVLPSDLEPWGVVVIEAVAAGIAVVASDLVGAAVDLVKPGTNGAIANAGDVTSLMAALRDVMQHASQYGSGSRRVLNDWLDWADPVSGLRSALQSCGILATAPLGYRTDSAS